MGIKALAPEVRQPIYSIYGLVRLADEIVDSFQGYDQAKILVQLRKDLQASIDEKISINPILHSFQQTYHQYQLDLELIDAFFRSMEMDLYPLRYVEDNYKTYIHGSAEVVGLMCLQVFVNGNKGLYDQLSPYAQKLGSVFQKVNFLRDFKSDHQELGRTYFPSVDFLKFGDTDKRCIEVEIEEEFKIAREGIFKLPNSAKWGVFLAYTYYYALFKKIKKLSANEMIKKRVRIPNTQKIALLLQSYCQLKLVKS